MFDDPSACVYVSKENVLQNGATSIKLMMSAHINVYSEIRAFYAISDTPNFEPVFTPFPGYNNLNSRGQIILIGVPKIFSKISISILSLTTGYTQTLAKLVCLLAPESKGEILTNL